MSSPLPSCVALLWALGLLPAFRGEAADWLHFEARQTHPVERALDGVRLLALHSLEGRLAVFHCGPDASDRPELVDEIPVGLEPVSVRARTADEVWVVNEVSDSVTIVSLARRAVVATLPSPDEPADVVFAGGRAFVSCARNALLRVFDAEERRELETVPLSGVFPRSLAVSATGEEVLVAFLHSGNGTTVLPAAAAPPPESPGNPALPPAPVVARIVDASDTRVGYRVLDHDVAVVSVRDPEQVKYMGGVGTSLFTIAARPGSQEWWVGNTEANNRTRYEPQLKNRFARNQLTRIDAGTGTRTFLDLSPFDAEGWPVAEGGAAAALAQPMSLVFSRDGQVAWVAAFASDRVARVSADTGEIEVRVDLRSPGEGSGSMRGPRGLVWDETAERLYVLNKLSSSLSVIDTRDARVLAEVPLASVDLLSATARAGRGLLFDARLSGNGATACGTCHIDADSDGLAWDLGDPAGEMANVVGANLAVHDPSPQNRPMHPMKGPMVTQTLRGLVPGQRLHWRGDRATLHDFNPTFRDLLGGKLQDDAQVEALTAYLGGLRHHPNPNRLPDDSLPESVAGGNAARGAKLFAAHLHHCGVCHVLPAGTDQNVDDPRNLRLSQPFKNPTLRTTYQRALLDTRAGATNTTGFGLLHDGSGGLQGLPTVHFYDLDALSGAAFQDVAAYVLCFDSGTAPVVGRSISLTADNRFTAATTRELDLLEAQAAKAGVCELALRGRLSRTLVQLQYDPTRAQYLFDDSVRAWSRDQLLAALEEGDALTALAVPFGHGLRLGRDRDGNTVPDAEDPRPRLTIHRPTGSILWPTNAPGWVLESARDVRGPWRVASPHASASDSAAQHSWGTDPTTFFRLRRTW